jgi:hypothetical protein
MIKKAIQPIPGGHAKKDLTYHAKCGIIDIGERRKCQLQMIFQSNV